MTVAVVQDIDVNGLNSEAWYALAILQNLAIEQLHHIKAQLHLGQPDTIGMQTLTAFVQLCQEKGIDLSAAGVNTFKDARGLGNQGPHQGRIGPQTATAYFETYFQAQPTTDQTPTAPQPHAATVHPHSGVEQASPPLNAAIAASAEALFDMATSDGPDGGNKACAWSVNKVLAAAQIAALGDNPNDVPSLLEALANGRGMEVSRANAQAGDLVIAYGEAHIGIGLDEGCRTVLSNSSSRQRFCWKSDTDFDGYYGGSSRIYRLVY